MDDKDNSENFKFEEDSKPNWLGQKPSDNPFDNNPFLESSEKPNTLPPKPEYTIDNPSIRANRSESNSLAKVLLALLASIGLLIAALWGLTHSNKNNISNPVPIQAEKQNTTKSPQNTNNNSEKPNNSVAKPIGKEGQDFCSLSLENEYKQKYLPVLSAERKQVENQIIALEEQETLTPQEEIDFENLQARLDTIDDDIDQITETENPSCKLSEAQKYISQSISNLDRITTKIEEKVEETKETKDKNQIQFLKDKLENLSRAEAEIRAFSEPYLQIFSGLARWNQRSH